MSKNQTDTFAAGEIPEDLKAREFTDTGQPDDGEAFLESAEPDFSLPDLEGRMHSLSSERGQKVLLVTWASW